jgi:hypothetical protein
MDMGWLRLILLGAGALFIALLVWWERRRPREAGRARAERSEPSFGAEAGAQAQPVAEPLFASDDERGQSALSTGPGLAEGGFGVGQASADEALRDREVRLPPPVIDWSDADLSLTGDAPEPDPSASAAQELPEAALLAALPPLRVEWPAEAERRIITLRILPARQDRLAGRALRQGLAGCGFRHGPFGIFHLPVEDGRVLLSAASLVRPGVLDPETMDFQRFSGINLFAVLPGPLPAAQALDRLAAVAAELADRIAGRVQDESGAAFNGARLAEWRQRGLQSLGGAPHPAAPGAAGASQAAAGHAD